MDTTTNSWAFILLRTCDGTLCACHIRPDEAAPDDAFTAALRLTALEQDDTFRGLANY